MGIKKSVVACTIYSWRMVYLFPNYRRNLYSLECLSDLCRISLYVLIVEKLQVKLEALENEAMP